MRPQDPSATDPRVIAVLCGLLGCSSPNGDNTDGGDAGLTGTLGGAPLQVLEQSAFRRIDASLGDLGYEIRLASFGGLCALEQAGQAKANGHTLVLQLKRSSLAPGTYPVDGKAIQMEYKVRDAACKDTKTDADSGSITLTAVSATEIAGTLDGKFGSDHVSGSFSAPMCDNVPANGSGACQP